MNRLTFGKLVQYMEDAQSNEPLLDSQDNTLSMDVVRSGMNLRKAECGDFWTDFTNLCGNSEALSELLEVPREKIAKWPSKISDLVEKIKQTDNQEDSDKKSMLSTGNEPVANPNGLDGAPNEPADTRPM